MGQLERLRNELDLANSTTPKLHVITTLLLGLPIDLLLRQPHAVQRPTHRDIGAKHIRRHRFLELRKQLRRTSRGARTNQRLPFPVLGRTHVITCRLAERTRERTIAPVRSQTQIDAIRRAFAARLARDARDRFRELDEVLAVTDFAALTDAG